MMAPFVTDGPEAMCAKYSISWKYWVSGNASHLVTKCHKMFMGLQSNAINQICRFSVIRKSFDRHKLFVSKQGETIHVCVYVFCSFLFVLTINCLCQNKVDLGIS